MGSLEEIWGLGGGWRWKVTQSDGGTIWALLFGDFPGPRFMTCSKPLALWSWKPAPRPAFSSCFFPWRRCCGVDNVRTLGAKTSPCVLQGGRGAPKPCALQIMPPKPHPVSLCLPKHSWLS